MAKDKKYYIETYEGEKLIGVLGEPTPALLEKIGLPSFMLKSMDGYWLLRGKHLSYVDRLSVKMIRPALKTDSESVRV